eukprot:17426_6
MNQHDGRIRLNNREREKWGTNQNGWRKRTKVSGCTAQPKSGSSALRGQFNAQDKRQGYEIPVQGVQDIIHVHCRPRNPRGAHQQQARGKDIPRLLRLGVRCRAQSRDGVQGHTGGVS